ncbi:hypothetical protein [Desulforamulus aquiferis]|uniref:Uncharacterized protein n=1 Tax=Desulforamulus aquiferis TaxID=1397668 RepID=A0AAW7ZEN4_9FIRM|nr:hypothetical protein [Desulforamulus aquiferis]MDO7787846.1 hypothetical protein [Desulforamulus aquiferis]RYD04054.1 hypothetical protein N752_16825 [Desulforamulus aquiferis]
MTSKLKRGLPGTPFNKGAKYMQEAGGEIGFSGRGKVQGNTDALSNTAPEVQKAPNRFLIM